MFFVKREWIQIDRQDFKFNQNAKRPNSSKPELEAMSENEKVKENY